MVSPVARKLVFRLGEVGFSIDLGAVVEIREQFDEVVDSSRSELTLGIVGSFSFRQTSIPAVDPTIKLGLMSKVTLADKIALVLKSPEGNWALLVDQIEEIGSHEQFISCEIPPLLKSASLNYYTQLELCRNNLLVVFEPEMFYGLVGAVA